MIRRSRLQRASFAILTIAVAALLVPSGTSPAGAAASYFPISGSGSTWSQNALDQWRKDVVPAGMTVNYSGQGSTAGRTDFIAGSVDFAISEIPFQLQRQDDGSAAENPTRGYAYMPIVAGGTSFMYNLKIGGKRVTNLRLSGEVITKIFTGAITNWNDAAIQADNPGLAMPDKAITPVVRSDGSGSSAQFTLWMSKQFGNIWTLGLRSQFPTPPNGKAQAQSLGVAGYVSQDYGEGAITYVEYSYALKAGFPVAKVLNKSGYFIEPTANSVAVALLTARINEDAASAEYLTQILDDVYNSNDPRAYPLSSYSYMIIPTKVEGIFNTDKGNTLGAFTRYVLCEGQQKAPQLGYSPLPYNLVVAASRQIEKIPGAGGGGIDLDSCNNPTFGPGGSNVLADSAPQPAACDAQGPDQCTTGTAGASEETPITGSGSGGAGTGTSAGAGGAAAAGATAGGAAAAGSAAGPAAGAVYDPETGELLSDGSATAAGSAVSSPFTLASDGWGTPQTMMLAAGVLLLAVIVSPIVFARRRTSAGTPPPRR